VRPHVTFEEMLSKGLSVTIFFYNPNIHPRREYLIRKEVRSTRL
jgi:predicted adenine nucleotide alpha hydrolase (AANH) superfamily ATPase